MKNSELNPKQISDFVGYQYYLSQKVIKCTTDRCKMLNLTIKCLLSRPVFFCLKILIEQRGQLSNYEPISLLFLNLLLVSFSPGAGFTKPP